MNNKLGLKGMILLAGMSGIGSANAESRETELMSGTMQVGRYSIPFDTLWINEEENPVFQTRIYDEDYGTLDSHTRCAVSETRVTYNHFLGEDIIDTFCEPAAALSNNPDAEKFINIVYDANDDGKLTQEEVKTGNERYDTYLKERVRGTASFNISSTFELSPLNMNQFKSQYQNFTASLNPTTPHQERLKSLIEYVIEKGDDPTIMEKSLRINEMPVSVFFSRNPSQDSRFEISSPNGTTYIDTGNNYGLNEQPTFLDGKLDMMESTNVNRFPVRHGYDGNYFERKSGTKQITPEDQKTFENLVRTAYEQIR